MPPLLWEYLPFRHTWQIAIEHETQRAKQYAFEVYVTDALKVLTENMAHAFGGNAMSQRLHDMLEQAAKPEDSRTADEIIAEIKEELAKMGDEKEN